MFRLDLKQQYLEEVNQAKQERIDRIIEVAKREFEKNGIINAKLKTIAKEARVGEASIYRYFTDKVNLTQLVAYDYWKEQIQVFDEYLEDKIDKKSTGIIKIRVLLELFIELYRSHRGFLKFMDDFDNYQTQTKFSNEGNEFIEYVCYIKKTFIDLVDEGMQDGSINPNFNKETTYSFVSQVMLSLTQKIVLRQNYEHSSNDEYAINCLNTTIDMFIQYIKNKKAI